MEYSERQPVPYETMHRLRETMPWLHPYTALVLSLEMMLERREIDTDEYLKWAAALRLSHGKQLFEMN